MSHRERVREREGGGWDGDDLDFQFIERTKLSRGQSLCQMISKRHTQRKQTTN